MKVLIINGSPKQNGNTSVAIKELVKTSEKENISFDS